ncbi:MAG: nucleotidyltransferase domain-containing protein [Candidatus Hydrogenedentes bacterium]|nr:nucleotidyltransferase domain-containing protein [Candidatus Hydrogenedentota bacterium]
MKPDQKVVEDAVNRIVTSVHPLSIFLFGSAVRGEMGPDSDLDFLVIVPDGADRIVTTQKLHRQLRGLGHAKDIVVVEQRDVDAYRDNPYLIIHTALTQGKEIYRAA